MLERLSLEHLAFLGEWGIIFLSTLLGKVGEAAGKGIAEYFLLFGFGMEGISVISESGLLLQIRCSGHSKIYCLKDQIIILRLKLIKNLKIS